MTTDTHNRRVRHRTFPSGKMPRLNPGLKSSIRTSHRQMNLRQYNHGTISKEQFIAQRSKKL